MKNYKKPEQIKRRWGRTFNSNDLSHLSFRSKPTSPLVLKNASNCNYNREKQLCRFMGFSNEKLIKIWTVIIPQLACSIHLSFDWFVTEACVDRNLKWKQKTLLWSNSTQALVAVSRASLVEVIWLCTRPLSVWITTSGSWRRERWDLLLVNTVAGNDLKDNWYILSIIIYYCFMSCQADVERQRDERRADELFRYFKDRSQPVLLWLIFRGPLAFVDSLQICFCQLYSDSL